MPLIIDFDITHLEDRDGLDICITCRRSSGSPCEHLEACAEARKLTLEMIQSDIRAQEDPLPSSPLAGCISGYHNGWVQGRLMALNAISDRRSGILDIFMARVAGTVRS